MLLPILFLAPGGPSHPQVNSSHTYPEARVDKSVFFMSKMRAHVAADARLTSSALYLEGPRRVFRGLGMGFRV